MKLTQTSVLPAKIFAILFFISHFLYFSVFNKYHLFYQEQVQLFRFSADYFYSLFYTPGGLSAYLGSFFIQFYIKPLAGPLLVTLSGVVVWLLSIRFFRKLNLYGILWSLIPVMIIAAMQSDQVYYLGFTIGITMILAFAVFFISVKSEILKFVSAGIGTIILYHFAGNLAIMAFIIIVTHELLNTRGSGRFIFAALYISLMALLYYLAWHHLYLLAEDSERLNILVKIGNPNMKYWLILLVSYFPAMIIISKMLPVFLKWNLDLHKWNVRIILPGVLILLLFGCGISKYAYDPKTELLLGVDYYVQKSEWDKALKLSSQLPGTNRIALYLSNLALYNSGHFADKLFSYNQMGSHGLFLGWGDDASSFFGCEVYYQLGYINEAYHWAFEAMVVKGRSPRLLKMLAKTSLINGCYPVADKYLGILDETLFYKGWANHYKKYLSDTSLIMNDKEISAKRRFLVHSDFFADVNNFDSELRNLIRNSHDNRMAYDYLLASLLLNKNIPEFISNVKNMKEYGYDKLPVHFEEAFLSLGGSFKPEMLPEGFMINESTRQRFAGYIKTSSETIVNSEKSMQKLYKNYGNTYWYYLQFR